MEKARLILPEWLWMVEASAPELFSPSSPKIRKGLFRVNLTVLRPMDFSPLLSLLPPWQFLNIEGQTLQRVNTGTFEPVSL